MIKMKDLLFEDEDVNDFFNKSPGVSGEIPDPNLWEQVPRGVYQEDMKKWIGEARKLVKEINTGKWLLPESERHYIYRGVPKVHPGWSIRDIRKDREPRDTPEWIDYILEVVRKRFFPEIPSRRKSKFGATSLQGRKEITEKYGYPYIVFPDKDGKVYSREEDAYYYVDEIKKTVTSVRYNIRDAKHEYKFEDVKKEFENEFPEVYDYVYSLFNFEENKRIDMGVSIQELIGRCEEVRIYFKKKKDNASRQMKDTYMMFGNVCYSGKESLEALNKFFSRMEGGVKPNSREVTFSGDSYLTVEESFWRHFVEFDFSDKRASLNPNYEDI